MKKILILLCVALCLGNVHALLTNNLNLTTDNQVQDDKTAKPQKRQWLPGEVKDTAQMNREAQARMRRDYTSSINLLSRSYGDSIVLRWAPDDYVTWKFLCKVGVDIVRYDVEESVSDTLCRNLKPSTLEQFRNAYSEEDSLAGMAMGTLYNQDALRPDQTKEPEGEVTSLFEIYQEQQMSFGVAVFVSELRPDLADRLQMRFADRNVKKGKRYEYRIIPSEPDPTGHIMVYETSTGEIVNEKYRPEPYDVEIGDSVNSIRGVRLWWTRKNYSSYEIERRKEGETAWTRINKHPYVVLMPEQEHMDCFFNDENLAPGAYEYRILAHDPFGDLTEPSQTHTVVIPDRIAPRAPQLTWINIDRPKEDDPSAEVWADIHFEKDTMEADLEGIDLLYYHERITQGEWRSLLDGQLINPTDTVCRINVTNIPTGMICAAAVDTEGNYGYSIPQLLRVSDMRPPAAPQGLKAETSLENGTITLTWNPVEEDDIAYYEVAFANDTTHKFLVLNEGKLRDTVYIDTVALDVNQKYIYYKVRAIDYSTNIGEYSEVLPVIRPSSIPPSVAHLDSAYVDGKGVYMRWIAGNDEQMAYHKVYRRLVSEKEWTLIRLCDADSVKLAGDVIELKDHPKENSYGQYAYAVESFNYSHVSSGLSMQYLTRFTGDPVFKLPIKLSGYYDKDKKMTKLAWEADKLPEGKDWYFCIWRKGAQDDRFMFLLSAEPDERDFSDRLLQAGENAEYFIQIQMEDGRESEPSNTITVSAPADKPIPADNGKKK